MDEVGWGWGRGDGMGCGGVWLGCGLNGSIDQQQRAVAASSGWDGMGWVVGWDGMGWAGLGWAGLRL